MANMRKLPYSCYAWLDGKAVVIRRGKAKPGPSSISQDQVNWHNYTNDISHAQLQAMICGVTLGWDRAGADPDYHSKDPMPLRHMQVHIPLSVTISVKAYSTADAIQEALEALEIPDDVIVDGSPQVTRID
jgi:hypothetical protein